MAKFEKGHEPLPGAGRPRKTEQQIRFEQRCRDWSDLNLFNYLAKHADSRDKDIFKWAITELANRGFGKPVETQVLDAIVSGPSGASPAELAAELGALVPRAKVEGGGTGGPGQVDSGK